MYFLYGKSPILNKLRCPFPAHALPDARILQHLNILLITIVPVLLHFSYFRIQLQLPFNDPHAVSSPLFFAALPTSFAAFSAVPSAFFTVFSNSPVSALILIVTPSANGVHLLEQKIIMHPGTAHRTRQVAADRLPHCCVAGRNAALAVAFRGRCHHSREFPSNAKYSDRRKAY